MNSRLLWWALVCNTEVALVAAYVVTADVTPLWPAAAVYYAYPFIWLNVAALGVAHVYRQSWTLGVSTRRRALAAAVGVGYFLLLGGVGGLYRLDGAATGVRVAWLPPGWGPTLLYGGGQLTASLFPFKLAGYGALAYLVYATVADAARSALSGVLGLFSCVSCTWPVAAALLGGVFGGTSVAATAAADVPYALSTAVFVSAVALLAWRPTVGSVLPGGNG
jgi:hypothetical protein